MSLRKQQSKFVRKIGLLILYAYELDFELSFGDTYPGKFKHNLTVSILKVLPLILTYSKVVVT